MKILQQKISVEKREFILTIYINISNEEQWKKI